jgi:predicted RNA-binding protein with EMAP domain
VTNSTVAATDVVSVSQKSGADLYQIFVTNVAAGSFKITFATTGGTTTEQPVFNFVVIKAVTA